jgi:hypothetical protein
LRTTRRAAWTSPIRQFDEWISLPENRDRMLPFPRTLAAIRVRRTDKEREDGGKLYKMFVNVSCKEADKKTFLYVRNGEQVWRIDVRLRVRRNDLPGPIDLRSEPSR